MANSRLPTIITICGSQERGVAEVAEFATIGEVDERHVIENSGDI